MVRLVRASGADLAVVDEQGRALEDLTAEHRRDRADRAYPSHLDVRSCDQLGDWWGDRWAGAWGLPPRPEQTFALNRLRRDEQRGTSTDAG